MSVGRDETYAATNEWYEREAVSFMDKARSGRDVRQYMDRFLAKVPDGGTILDAGCGPGFDTVEFLKRGYKVVAVDRCLSMVKLASEAVAAAGFEAVAAAGFESGARLVLKRMSLHSFDYDDELRWRSSGFVDGIWSNACLDHIAPCDIPFVISNLAACLRHNGPLWASFRSTEFDGKIISNDGGRTFFHHNFRLMTTRLNRSRLNVVEWYGHKENDVNWETMLCVQQDKRG